MQLSVHSYQSLTKLHYQKHFSAFLLSCFTFTSMSSLIMENQSSGDLLTLILYFNLGDVKNSMRLSIFE